MRGLKQRKEKTIQEGWKRKNNQFRNIINCSLGHPSQGENSLLVGMGGWLVPIIFDIEGGLSRPISGWGRSLDQGRFTETYDPPEER